MLRVLTACVIALTLAGCGGSGISYDPNGAWSAGDQGSFAGACTGDGGSDIFCRCALEDAMGQYPDTHDLPGPLVTGGMTAAEHPGDFPDCQSGQ